MTRTSRKLHTADLHADEHLWNLARQGVTIADGGTAAPSDFSKGTVHWYVAVLHSTADSTVVAAAAYDSKSMIHTFENPFFSALVPALVPGCAAAVLLPLLPLPLLAATTVDAEPPDPMTCVHQAVIWQSKHCADPNWV